MIQEWTFPEELSKRKGPKTRTKAQDDAAEAQASTMQMRGNCTLEEERGALTKEADEEENGGSKMRIALRLQRTAAATTEAAQVRPE